MTIKNQKLIDFSPEIDCNKKAMGLPPVASALFLIAY
jgi:hypothetical protein